MKIFQRIRDEWRKMSTEEKIGVIVDVICGIGSGCINVTVGKKLCEGKSIPEKICIRTVTAGLSLAGGKLAANELKEEYGKPVSVIVDKLRKKEANAQ